MTFSEIKNMASSLGLTDYQSGKVAEWCDDLQIHQRRDITKEEIVNRASVYLSKTTKRKINKVPGITGMLELCDKE